MKGAWPNFEPDAGDVIAEMNLRRRKANGRAVLRNLPGERQAVVVEYAKGHSLEETRAWLGQGWRRGEREGAWELAGGLAAGRSPGEVAA
jgi:hypothetical protein